MPIAPYSLSFSARYSRRAAAGVLRHSQSGVADVEVLGDHPDLDRLAGPHRVAVLVRGTRSTRASASSACPAGSSRRRARRRGAARASTSPRSRSAGAAAAPGGAASPTSPTYSLVHDVEDAVDRLVGEPAAVGERDAERLELALDVARRRRRGSPGRRRGGRASRTPSRSRAGGGTRRRRRSSSAGPARSGRRSSRASRPG